VNTSRRSFITSATAVAAVGGAAPLAADNAHASPAKGAARVQSISAMTLAPDGRLIVADWRRGALHALKLPPLAATPERSFNVLDLSDRLARAFAIGADALRVTAVALHPASQTAVVAVALGRQPAAPVGLALVDAAGAVHRLDPDRALEATQLLTATPAGSAPGASTPAADAALWGRTPARTLVVTDIKAHGSELIVAGLAHASFDSTLRRVPYPFTGASSTVAVEMYHAVHNQIETRAPVRAFNIIDVAGEPTLLAAYTCTPLVTVPLAALKDGAKVRGKTIAELGFGNTPLDVLPFSITHKGQKSDWVLVANSAKAADLISLPDVVAAAQGPGLSQPVAAPFSQLAGVKSIPLPITNVQRVLDQGPQFLVALRRNPHDGQLQLVSIRKGAFFRLSDFVNEYDLPGYTYPEGDAFQQEYIRPFHKMMKNDEGHAALVR
jgi:hypothetical protein